MKKRKTNKSDSNKTKNLMTIRRFVTEFTEVTQWVLHSRSGPLLGL